MTDQPTDAAAPGSAAESGGAAAAARPATDAAAGADPGNDGAPGPDATAADRELLRRARELGQLDLADRPDAFADLDSAIVDELRAIEDL